MKKVLITGLSGTLAPWVAKAAEARRWDVIGWDRHAVDPTHEAQSQQYLEREAPDAIVHLALGPERWAALLAAYAAPRGLPFVLVSTAMVFDAGAGGPHWPTDPRTSQDEYGQYKIRCEDAVMAANPSAMVARIGWQIAPDAKGNNMLRQLDEQHARDGHIRASTAWRPACSFMRDTADALCALVAQPVAGAVHLDSNAADGWTFDQVVRALARKFDRPWTIQPDDAYVHDQRLMSPQGQVVPALSETLR